MFSVSWISKSAGSRFSQHSAIGQWFKDTLRHGYAIYQIPQPPEPKTRPEEILTDRLGWSLFQARLAHGTTATGLPGIALWAQKANRSIYARGVSRICGGRRTAPSSRSPLISSGISIEANGWDRAPGRVYATVWQN